ncbi:MAG: DUF72 domain-containing protein [Planctomycetota bacterium]
MPDELHNTRIALGTMGFGYPDWQHVFYEHTGSKLRQYAERFDTVELDTTFHAVPPKDRVARWAGEVPDDFVFTAKMTQDVTHGPNLRSVEAGKFTKLWIDSLTQLGTKLGSALLQFPAAFTADRFDELATYLATLPTELPWAVELRHDSWWHGETAGLFKAHDIAWVHADEPPVDIVNLPPDDPRALQTYACRKPVMTSATFYLRLIGRHDQFPDKARLYADPEPRLQWWADRIRDLAALRRLNLILIYLNNGYAGHSPACVRRLREMLGFKPTLGVGTLFE